MYTYMGLFDTKHFFTGLIFVQNAVLTSDPTLYLEHLLSAYPTLGTWSLSQVTCIPCGRQYHTTERFTEHYIQMPVILQCRYLDCSRKETKVNVGNPQRTRRTFKVHTHRVEMGISHPNPKGYKCNISLRSLNKRCQ